MGNIRKNYNMGVVNESEFGKVLGQLAGHDWDAGLDEMELMRFVVLNCREETVEKSVEFLGKFLGRFAVQNALMKIVYGYLIAGQNVEAIFLLFERLVEDEKNLDIFRKFNLHRIFIDYYKKYLLETSQCEYFHIVYKHEFVKKKGRISSEYSKEFNTTLNGKDNSSEADSIVPPLHIHADSVVSLTRSSRREINHDLDDDDLESIQSIVGESFTESNRKITATELLNNFGRKIGQMSITPDLNSLMTIKRGMALEASIPTLRKSMISLNLDQSLIINDISNPFNLDLTDIQYTSQKLQKYKCLRLLHQLSPEKDIPANIFIQDLTNFHPQSSIERACQEIIFRILKKEKVNQKLIQRKKTSKSTRIKRDLFLWRWTGIVTKVISKKDSTELNHQLRLLCLYLRRCNSTVTAPFFLQSLDILTQIQDMCQNMNYEKDKRNAQTIHEFLKILQLVHNEDHQTLREFIIENFIECKTTWTWIEEFTNFVFTADVEYGLRLGTIQYYTSLVKLFHTTTYSMLDKVSMDDLLGFLLNPVRGIVLTQLQSNQSNARISSVLLQFLACVFRYIPDSCYSETYIRFHFLNFVKLYTNDDYSEHSFQTCIDHLNVLIEQGRSNSKEVFIQLNAVRFMIEEMNLEAQIFEDAEKMNLQNNFLQMKKPESTDISDQDESENVDSTAPSIDESSIADEPENEDDTGSNLSASESDEDIPLVSDRSMPSNINIPSLSFGLQKNSSRRIASKTPRIIESQGAVIMNQLYSTRGEREVNSEDDSELTDDSPLPKNASVPKLSLQTSATPLKCNEDENIDAEMGMSDEGSVSTDDSYLTDDSPIPSNDAIPSLNFKNESQSKELAEERDIVEDSESINPMNVVSTINGTNLPNNDKVRKITMPPLSFGPSSLTPESTKTSTQNGNKKDFEYSDDMDGSVSTNDESDEYPVSPVSKVQQMDNFSVPPLSIGKPMSRPPDQDTVALQNNTPYKIPSISKANVNGSLTNIPLIEKYVLSKVKFTPDREERKIYHNDLLHVKMIVFLLCLLIDENDTLDSEYSARMPHMSGKVNIPFILYHHLNSTENARLCHELVKEVEKTRIFGVKILLRMLSRSLFHPELYQNRTKCLGKGGFGSVWECDLSSNLEFDSEIAIKLIDLPGNKEEKCVWYHSFNEILIMEKYKGNRHICELVDYGVDDNFLYLVMKKYKCNLLEWRRKQTLPIRMMLPIYMNVFRKVCNSLNYLKGQGIHHFDLKCENVFLNPHPGVSDREFYDIQSEEPTFDVLLGDFGESHVYGVGDDYFLEHRGTIRIKSPEMLQLELHNREGINFDRRKKIGVDRRSDIWSLGCLFFELLTGEFLFDDSNFPTFFALLNNSEENLMPHASYQKLEYNSLMNDIIMDMLIRDPERRPDIQDILIRFSHWMKPIPSLKHIREHYLKKGQLPARTTDLLVPEKKISKPPVFKSKASFHVTDEIQEEMIEIFSYLYAGFFHETIQNDHLHGFTHLIGCSTIQENLKNQLSCYEHMQFDMLLSDSRLHLEVIKLITWIRNAVESGGKILIYSTDKIGFGRAIILTLIFMMKTYGFSSLEAFLEFYSSIRSQWISNIDHLWYFITSHQEISSYLQTYTTDHHAFQAAQIACEAQLVKDPQDKIHWYQCRCGSCVYGIRFPHYQKSKIDTTTIDEITCPLRDVPTYFTEMQRLYPTKNKEMSIAVVGLESTYIINKNQAQPETYSNWTIYRCKQCRVMTFCIKKQKRSNIVLGSGSTVQQSKDIVLNIDESLDGCSRDLRRQYIWKHLACKR